MGTKRLMARHKHGGGPARPGSKRLMARHKAGPAHAFAASTRPGAKRFMARHKHGYKVRVQPGYKYPAAPADVKPYVQPGSAAPVDVKSKKCPNCQSTALSKTSDGAIIRCNQCGYQPVDRGGVTAKIVPVP